MTKREMIEQESARVERIFNRDGEVLQYWYVFTPKGDRLLPPPPSRPATRSAGSPSSRRSTRRAGR